MAPAFIMGDALVVVAGAHAATTMDLVQIIQTSDVPAGVVNIVAAEDPFSVTKVLALHDDVDALWYFGKPAHRKALQEAAAKSNLKRLFMPANATSLDWKGRQGRSKSFLREATQVKTIWYPFGT